MERRLLGKKFSLFRENNLQCLQSKQEESTEEEEMKQQQIMATTKDLVRKIDQKEERIPRADGGFRSFWRQIVKKHGLMQDGKTSCRNGTNGWNT